MEWLIIKPSNDCIGLIRAANTDARQILCIDAYLIFVTQAQYVMGEIIIGHHQIGAFGCGMKVFLIFIANSGTETIKKISEYYDDVIDFR